MLAFALDNGCKSRWPVAPIRILARHDGVYRLPIVVHGLDFRFEDNKGCDLRKAIGLGSHWIAHHPLDDFYVICMHGVVEATHATRKFIRSLQYDGELPPDLYRLPDEGEHAWWEWVVGFNSQGSIIKAPKAPRQADPTPEQVDECYESVSYSTVEFNAILLQMDQESAKLVTDSVRTKAYYLWREAGSPRSSGYEFWVRAESLYTDQNAA